MYMVFLDGKTRAKNKRQEEQAKKMNPKKKV
jgi:hypothetical protein